MELSIIIWNIYYVYHALSIYGTYITLTVMQSNLALEDGILEKVVQKEVGKSGVLVKGLFDVPQKHTEEKQPLTQFTAIHTLYSNYCTPLSRPTS